LHQRLGIIGGTFNPIHYGHLAAADEVRDRLKLDQVLFIPSFLPPHKQEEDMPSAAQRMEMARLAVKGHDQFKVSDLEVKRGGKSYTIDTIEALRSLHTDSDLYFITGLDSFLDIQTWKEWERLLRICSFVVLSRPGYSFADLKKIEFMNGSSRDLAALDRQETSETVVTSDAVKIILERISLYDISSTDIRTRVRQARTIKYHLPESVEHYIIENKLYA
jgi:nicotinate-nucleotide adenylyltransferase